MPAERTMHGPPDHPITIEPAPHRVRVTFAGRVVADSARALVLREAKYPPVTYIPRDAVDFSLLKRTDHKTHCPYKGDASYYSIEVDGRTSDKEIWTSDRPFPGMS